MGRMKKRGPGFVRFILRIDNINRILVIVSRIFYLALPSYLLFHLHDQQNWKEIVIPCLIRLAAALGDGLLCVYRPTRRTFLYFFERFCILLVRFVTQAPFGRNLALSVHSIVIVLLVYACLGRIVNLSFLGYYLRKRTLWGKNSRKEGTNGDSAYDFLNAKPTNKKIENDLESIPEGTEKQRRKRIKQTKLSKVRRTIGFIVAILRFVVAFIQSNQSFNLTFQVSLVGVLVLPLFYFGSLQFPRHFKYGFFLNGRRLRICDYLSFEFSGGPSALNFCFILFRIIFGISFLVCLIVEGRIWTGAPEDD